MVEITGKLMSEVKPRRTYDMTRNFPLSARKAKNLFFSTIGPKVALFSLTVNCTKKNYYFLGPVRQCKNRMCCSLVNKEFCTYRYRFTNVKKKIGAKIGKCMSRYREIFELLQVDLQNCSESNSKIFLPQPINVFVSITLEFLVTTIRILLF